MAGGVRQAGRMSTELPSGSLHRGFAGGQTVRFLAVEAKKLVAHTAATHGLSPGAARLAGEASVAALLMSAWIKGDERVTLQIQSERPRFAFVGEVDAEGGLRARLTPEHVHAAPGAPLQGVLMAVKADARKELYRGMTPLDGETIERALVNHLAQSDQVDIALRIQVVLADDGTVRTAGGLLVERLPEHNVHAWIDSETFQATYGHIREQDIGELHTALAFGQLAGEAVELLENRTLEWRCRCSNDKVRGMLLRLGAAELRSIRDELGQAEVTCHFCNVARVTDRAGLDRLIDLLEAHTEQG